MELKCKTNLLPLLVGYSVLILAAYISGLVFYAGTVFAPMLATQPSVPLTWCIGFAAIAFAIGSIGAIGAALIEELIGVPLLRLFGLRLIYQGRA